MPLAPSEANGEHQPSYSRHDDRTGDGVTFDAVLDERRSHDDHRAAVVFRRSGHDVGPGSSACDPSLSGLWADRDARSPALRPLLAQAGGAPGDLMTLLSTATFETRALPRARGLVSCHVDRSRHYRMT